MTITTKILGEVLPYICLTGIDVKKGLGSVFGQPDKTPPPQVPWNIPGFVS